MHTLSRLWLAPLLPALPLTPAQAATFTVPREKISLVCTDTYFKVSRVDFVLPDETYNQYKLLPPLALRERWLVRRCPVPPVRAS